MQYFESILGYATVLFSISFAIYLYRKYYISEGVKK